MIAGGSDTHDLAEAAKKQADAAKTQADRMKDFADRMKDQSDRTKDLADRMKDQADRTKTIADQAIIQANAAKLSANAAQSAAETSKEAMELSQRPWLVVRATISSPFTFDKEGGHITLHYLIVNVGHSPATGVNIWPEFYVANGKKPDAMIERTRLCKELSPRSATFGQTIFPGELFEINESFGVPRADIDESTKHFGTTFFVTSIVDCVVYHAKFVKEAYSVGSSYDLAKPLGPGIYGSFPAYIDMPLGSLVLVPQAFSPVDVQ